MQTDHSDSDVPLCPPPDTAHLVTKDDTPVDIFTQSQASLLTGTLYASWSGPPLEVGQSARTFQIFSNVGVFASIHEPPVVPDVMLSLDITLPKDLSKLMNLAYFLWEFGKFPEVIIEIVSDDTGVELGDKMRRYRRMGIKYYVVYDPHQYLSSTLLRSFELRGDSYAELEHHVYEPIGLGLIEWEGKHQNRSARWIRWCTNDGRLIPTSLEKMEEARAKRADETSKRADETSKRADETSKRVEQLAAKLRALGIDPDAA